MIFKKHPRPFTSFTALAGCLLLLALGAGLGPLANRAEAQPKEDKKEPAAHPMNPQPPAKVEVKPVAEDTEIQERLFNILQATGWFSNPQVKVQEGVVFLDGEVDRPQHKQWAGDLASNTQAVVAVVNRIDVTNPKFWDFTPAWEEFLELLRGLIQSLPLFVWALIILVLAWFAGKLVSRLVRTVATTRLRSRLLAEVTARAAGILIFLLGLYLVFRTTGLTRLALTVIGGTGVIGLILGIAFREISENFLASIFLSIQHPFREGDLVEISGVLGYVKRVTSRTTILMTLDGNQVQIPNATVFKSTIRNYTSNPNRREDFTVGIGYDATVPQAQEIALRILAEHPAVLKEPEPWVLVDNLGTSTVNLKIYFWLDGTRHSWLKVRSSVIRLVKRAYQDAGISLPDEAREVVFQNGLQVHLVRPDRQQDAPPPAPEAGPEVVTTQAEGGLRSEADAIDALARHSWTPGDGENLLAGSERDGRPG